MVKIKVWKWMSTMLIIMISLYFIQCLLMPKYVGDVIEGALIAEYYQEEKCHDVIFIGDCEVYENFSPVVLWEEYGINSYIRGSAQQLIWQSYYLLEDTLRYEKPDVVIFNVLSMQYDVPQNEAYNRMTLEGMRWSMSKISAIQASMTENEHFIDYVFPVLRYHSRWNQLGVEDIAYLFKRKRVSYNGYYMQMGIKPVETVPEGRILADYSFGDNAYTYLDKITKLCKENNILLILVKAPSIYPYWYEEWEEQIEAYAAANDLMYLNFLKRIEEIKIDYSKDTYDAGQHLNLFGAEKITRYLGRILREEVGLGDRRGESPLSERWDEKITTYEQEKACFQNSCYCKDLEDM